MLLLSDDVGQDNRLLALQNTYQIQCSYAHGLCADFVWFPQGKSYGIELKVAGDLLGSLGDKRLAGQVRKMTETLDFPILLIQGSLTMQPASGKLLLNGEPTNWEYRSVMSLLAEVGMAGVFVEQWAAPNVAERIASWYMITQKEDHAWLKQRTRPEVMTLDPAYSNSIWALCAADGVGPKTAEGMLKKYGSLADVYVEAARINLSLPDKKKAGREFAKGVEGLGAKKAESFIREVCGT